ncbi:methylesterase 17, partial [Morus notabilis]
ADPDLSEYGDVSELIYMLGPNQPPTSVIMKPEFQRKIYYDMSPIEDSTLASMLPIRAFQGAKFMEGPGADSVPRVYIKTLYNRVIKQEQQDAMINRWPPSQVFFLESDHSPFFSNPDVLFSFLLKAATF